MYRITSYFLFVVLVAFMPAYVVSAEEADIDHRILEKRNQLIEIRKSIAIAKQDLDSLNQQIESTKEKSEQKPLLENKEQVLSRIESLMFNFEEIATGGVKLVDYSRKKEEKKFNLEEELIEIFKPMLSELKELTERPRVIERIRSEKSRLEAELPVARRALQNIDALKLQINDESTLMELSRIELEWHKRISDLETQLQLANFQLNEKLNPPENTGGFTLDKLNEFFAGRGLTIILAFLAFFIIFISFASLSHTVEKRITRSAERHKLFFQRAMRLGLQILTVIFALFAAVLVLYVRGDWLILGFIMIIVLGIALALRQSLPKYVREAKLMLNMGSVREGERVIYNGVPWKVSNLNVFTTLTNPALSGGSIRLPVGALVDMHSRKPCAEECWFPSETGDYVILDNDYYGPVVLQTPDIVQMRVLGGSIKTFSTTDYLSLNPRNISKGFGLFMSFGLDYNLQAEITKTIPEKLEKELNEQIQTESFANDLLALNVAFKQASGSSLDLLLMVTFNGKAAGDYYAIGRFLQRTTVDYCTKNHWNIPFQNITLHLNKPN